MLRFIQIMLGIASILSLTIVLMYAILRPNHIDWLVYTVADEHTSAIYKMRPDGSAKQKLSPGTGRDSAPQWSADGRWILFESRTDQTAREIYVMRADGSELRNLSQNALPDSDASWSPDGQQIAYLSNREGYQQIYQIQRNGSQRTNISPDNRTWGFPYWSPQGKWILYMHWLTGLKLYNVSTGQLQLLANPSRIGTTQHIQWAPHGRWLILSTRFDRSIIRVDVPSGRIEFISNFDIATDFPQVSPDSHWLAFVEIQRMSDRLLLQNLATGETQVLAEFDYINQPRWSPDGRWLVFPALVNENWDIYRIHRDGTRLENLTNSTTNEREVQWSMSVLIMDWHPVYWVSGLVPVLTYLAIVYREFLQALWHITRQYLRQLKMGMHDT